ncbi:histidine phosphatase family protein [Bacillus salipaludis]|uniref:Histidine phosphatase family protein n=1 Tax=Bacillus salipaludis TaxID=2547811 RepID=A0ABW8RDJ9_9BACI
MVIALFRHGVTEENKRKAYLGWNDSPLLAESRKMSPLKRYESYFSSDLQRCLSTSNLFFPHQKPIIIEAFREMNFGEWEGQTYEDLKENERYRQWLSDPLSVFPPKGESFHEFTRRVQAGWNKMIHIILSQTLKSGAVITHGGVIRYLLTRYAPEEKDFWSFQAQHDQGFELIFTREALKGDRRCTSLLEVPLMANEHG